MMDFVSILRCYARYLLIIFNLIFSLSGVILISVGITAKAYFHHFDSLLDNKYFYMSDLLIVIGVVVFFIAFFGCCGAIKENACMTSTFSTLLIIVFLLEVMIGIAGFLLKNRTEDILIESLDKTMGRYKNDSEITLVWDNIQTELHCCGVVNATDWETKTNTTKHQVPLSCCKIPPGATGDFQCGVDNAYDEGCLTALGDYLRHHITFVEVVGISLAVLQFLGIVASCFLSKAIRSDYETV